MKHNDLAVLPWRDYELIDSGDNRKLERYGKYILIRPETQAIWKTAHPEAWKRANAEFRWADKKGSWLKKSGMPEAWELSWEDVRFTARLTSFKHTGVFPEQAANWQWLSERAKALAGTGARTRGQSEGPPHVLNLFGYTGIASIAAAKAGARVTHVDASRQSNMWAKENARLSGIPEESIRYLLDDALKFAEREVRRGAAYDGIVLDPPAFGRGADGEVWRIEEHILKLLDALKAILSKKPGAFFLLNGYAAGYAPQSFLQAMESCFPEVKKNATGEFGELRIREADSERCIPSGIYVRFVR